MSKSQWFRNGGSPHRGWYRGIWVDSSWELAFLVWHLDRRVEIIRNTKDFPYSFRNGVKYYRPDFIVDGVFYEVKGVMDYRSKRKISNFPYPIKVIGSREIKKYLEYAESKYGRSFFQLLQRDDSYIIKKQ